MAVLNLLPESPERDLRELDLRQLAAEMLYITRGYSAPETTEAIERAGQVAEKTGNLSQIVSNTLSRILAPLNSGDLPVAGALADQALELALREGSPSAIGMAHAFQTVTRYNRGDLVGADEHYKVWLGFSDDPVFERVPGATLWTFGQASFTAWMLGRADVARERMARMMAFANKNNPYDLAISGICAAVLRRYLREYDQAEALAAKAPELSEKNQFPPEAAYARATLGLARAQLGRTSDGIALIRQGIASGLEIGATVGIPGDLLSLATAQMLDGVIIEALKTVERAL